MSNRTQSLLARVVAAAAVLYVCVRQRHDATFVVGIALAAMPILVHVVWSAFTPNFHRRPTALKMVLAMTPGVLIMSVPAATSPSVSVDIPMAALLAAMWAAMLFASARLDGLVRDAYPSGDMPEHAPPAA